MADLTLTQTWKVAGVALDATSMTLSDPTGSYGIKRNDTDAVVVADGTAMADGGAGLYSHTFAEPAPGLTYTAAVEVVFGGRTYYFEVEFSASTSGTLSSIYADLRTRIARYLGYGRSGSWGSDEVASIEDALNDGLRDFYSPVDPDPRARKLLTHQWSFLKPRATLCTQAPYSTGTITIVSGVVTLAGGTWPSWAASAELREEQDGNTYTVASRDSDSQLTLDDTTVNVAAGTTYWLAPAYYDLPSDFAALLGPFTYDPGVSDLYPPLEVVQESQIRAKRQGYDYTDRPVMAAPFVKAHDATVGTRWALAVFPLADAAYRLTYRYQINPGAFGESDHYPPGWESHAQTIIAACLAAAELNENDGPGPWAAKFQGLLAQSVVRDQEATAADYLGYASDPGMEPDCTDGVLPSGGVHTVEGVAYYD